MKTVQAISIPSILLVAVCTFAADKRPTGFVQGSVYQDSAFRFTLRKYDNWKFGKIEKEDPAAPRFRRCILLQSNFQVPAEFYGNEDKFTPAKVGVYVDTTSMALEAYAAEMSNRKSRHPSRKELVSDFAVLGRGQFVEQGPTRLDSLPAIVQHYRQDYEVQLYDRAQDQYRLMDDALLGDLYLVKRSDTVFVVHLTCERSVYRIVNDEALAMIMAIDLHPVVDSSLGDHSGAESR
jgi:hypothetical protein